MYDILLYSDGDIVSLNNTADVTYALQKYGMDKITLYRKFAQFIVCMVWNL